MQMRALGKTNGGLWWRRRAFQQETPVEGIMLNRGLKSYGLELAV